MLDLITFANFIYKAHQYESIIKTHDEKYYYYNPLNIPSDEL